MRFYGLALLASATVLGACGGGGENKAADTTKAPPAAAPTTTAAPAGALAPIPATGDTVQVKMISDDKGYRFEPANITIKSGQAVKFTMVGAGGPHNVAFDPATVPAESKDQLNANMVGQMSELSSAMVMNAGEAVTISFGGVKPGTYPFHCTPHLAMNMKGTITVQ
jgi:plastocyanin